MRETYNGQAFSANITCVDNKGLLYTFPRSNITTNIVLPYYNFHRHRFVWNEGQADLSVALKRDE